MAKAALSLEGVGAFLSELHGAPVTDLHPLDGGYWSSAFGYRTGGRELVLRHGSVPEGFQMDRSAMAFAGPDLPVPEVLAIGEALDGAYAVSVRHHGRFLETVSPDEAERAGPTIVRTLVALRAVPVDPGAPVSWGPDASVGASTWRDWLTHGLVDDPRRRVRGWRATLAADAGIDRLFVACERRIEALLDACPERRDLVHGDLLNANVLIDEDASQVTAVFSWKCSVHGDFVYDLAWCTFWGAWHEGVAAASLWDRMLDASSADVLVDAALRHHCYELQIGATHLGWHAWTGDGEGLRSVATRLAEVLERGPLPYRRS